MEIDIPQQVNGFAQQAAEPTNGYSHSHVEFNGVTEVKTYKVIEQQQRTKHKARRRARVPKLEIGEDGATTSNALPKPASPSKLKKMAEKDRHSRTGYRGLPKKGGAGGKGTWGKLTDLYDEDGHTRDTKDPNYDSVDEEEAYVVSPSSPQIDSEQFAKQAKVIFQEYFNHGDTQEVADSLEEFNIRNMKHEIISILVTVALEERDANRELASILISDLYGSVINSRDVANGFDIVLSQLGDLSLDTPDASHVLGNFIARCVADDCLPPAYVNNHAESSDPRINAALKRAKLLLNMKHGIARLDNVWGVGGGQRPVMFLVSKINLLLKEYLSSGDREEAVRCLRELEVPHFHHEVVYEGVVLVLENGSEQCAEMITTLLQYMGHIGILSYDQLNQGFLRVFDDLHDIVLDVPNAYHTLSKFVERGAQAGFVTRIVAEQLPSRGRKRYVSEGDGGAIKPPED